MTDDAGKTAGRGVIFIGAAKGYFMVSGAAIHTILPRLLKSPVLWGNYLLVTKLVSVINMVLVSGTIQAVSRFTAQGATDPLAIRRAALKVQLLVGGGMAALYVVAAPWVAAVERDPDLAPLYRLSAGIIVCYALYAVFIGSLNGLKHFGKQASFDIGYATIRTAFILLGAAMGVGVIGAVGGFVAAAFTILCVAAYVVRFPKSAERFDVSRIVRFIVPLFAFHFAMNMTLNIDQMLLKRFAGTLELGALSGVLGGLDPAKIASAAAGFYGSAQYLAFIPYQAILVVTFVVFPLVSRSTFEQDLETTQTYIKQTLRLSLIFAAGMAFTLMANPAAVLAVPYQDQYRVGADALRILSVGMIGFSMFTVICTILNGAGKAFGALGCALLMIITSAVLNWVAIPRAADQLEGLRHVAMASSVGMAAGLIAAMILLYRSYRAAFPIATVVRVVIAGGGALLVGHLIPEVSRLFTVVECMLVFAAYFGILVGLREFTRSDLGKLRGSMFRR